jgi:hypothetical protein
MAMFAYFNNGINLKSVDPSYVAQTGEVLFLDYATPAELTAAFPGYAAAAAAQAVAQANAPIIAQVAALQSAQADSVRALVLQLAASLPVPTTGAGTITQVDPATGAVTAGVDPLTTLQSIDSQISTLYGTLQS